ncbi:MAG: MFS transporter [Alphaproteobacteria bacterium]|nr:MFS transporter [Alphaproteobacteria bacterium]
MLSSTPPTFFEKISHKIRIVENARNNVSLWGVAWMSFFWSTSTLMAMSILPIFITEVMGASKTKLGIMEGIAVSLSFFAKVFSGVLSDYFKNRKPLILIGTFFSIMIKPMLAIAGTINMIFAVRFIDRLSKGIRSAPTDALIADLSPKERRGASFGMRQSLYTFGGMFGALLASILMSATHHDYRLIFMLSTIPVALAFFILMFVVKQPPILEQGKKIDWKFSDIKFLPPRYWALLCVVFILFLARFSESFVTLRAKEAGWPLAALPLIHVLMDIVHASMAFPMGKLSDKFNRYKMLLIGLILTVCAHFSMIADVHPAMIFLGVIFVGLYLGIMQGLLSTLVSEAIPAHLRGTGFAMYYFVLGISLLIGNFVAGKLSDIFGLVGAFWGGAGFTALAIITLLLMMGIFKGKTTSVSVGH